MNGITREPVKVSEILAAAGTGGAIASWLVQHQQEVEHALRTYTGAVGAIGGTFAMIYWIRRCWQNKDKE